VRDYASLTTQTPGTAPVAFAGAKGDLIMFDLASVFDPAAVPASGFPGLGNAVAARPSGTEPKIKFYLFAVAPPGAPQDLANAKQMLGERLDRLESELRTLAGV